MQLGGELPYRARHGTEVLHPKQESINLADRHLPEAVAEGLATIIVLHANVERWPEAQGVQRNAAPLKCLR